MLPCGLLPWSAAARHSSPTHLIEVRLPKLIGEYLHPARSDLPSFKALGPEFRFCILFLLLRSISLLWGYACFFLLLISHSLWRGAAGQIGARSFIAILGSVWGEIAGYCKFTRFLRHYWSVSKSSLLQRSQSKRAKTVVYAPNLTRATRDRNTTAYE